MLEQTSQPTAITVTRLPFPALGFPHQLRVVVAAVSTMAQRPGQTAALAVVVRVEELQQPEGQQRPAQATLAALVIKKMLAEAAVRMLLAQQALLEVVMALLAGMVSSGWMATTMQAVEVVPGETVAILKHLEALAAEGILLVATTVRINVLVLERQTPEAAVAGIVVTTTPAQAIQHLALAALAS